MARMRLLPLVLSATCLAMPANAGAAQAPAATRSVLHESAFVGRTVVRGITAPLTWSTRDWMRVGGGIAALATLSLADGAARDVARRNQGRTGDAVARALKPFGRAGSAAVVGAFLAGGLVLDDDRARAVAIDAIASTLVTSALVIPALQESVGRSRPWREEGSHEFRPFGGGRSFPSGHAGQAFAVATVIAQHYDAIWVDALAYGGAGLVAASRIYHDAHHLSDVTASALIAMMVGRTVVRSGLLERNAASLRPAVGPGTIGLTFTF